MGVSSNDDSSGADPRQLTGWKEISAYIGKGVRQAQRWEKLGMPVHRVAGMDGVVYAYRSEINAWRESSAGRDAETYGHAAVTVAPSESPADDGSSAERAGPMRFLPSRFRFVWIAVAGIFLALGFGGYRYLAGPPLQVALESPPEAGQGGSFRFSAKGGETGLKIAYRIMRNPRGGEHVVAPPVPRDPDGSFIWVFSTDCQTPPGRHEVSLADSGGKTLTKAVAVMVRESPACQGAVPDIQADFITITPEQISEGGSIRYRFILRNQGAGAASPSMTRLRLSRSPMRSSVSDVRLGDVAAPLLRPGEESTFEGVIALPPSAAPGVYYIWVVADNNSDNVESFTHNNYAKSAPVLVSSRPK